MIKPDAVQAGCAEAIMDKIEAAGLKIIRRRYYRLYPTQAQRFYSEHQGKSFYNGLVDFMTSGPIWALELEGVDSIRAWRKLMGPTNTLTAQEEAPESLRAQFGIDGTKNATHGSDSVESAAREIEFHFPPVESTLAMIKPDSMAAGHADTIIEQIEKQGFKIIQRRSYQLSEAQAKEFYAEHVSKPFFPKLLDFMTSGPIWALELGMHGAIGAWRAMMGPTNSDSARATAPTTIRAHFGIDGTKNAVHGSDSPESAAREIAFHFPVKPSVENQLNRDECSINMPSSNLVTSEKHQATIAEEEAAASKIQAAVRERQAGKDTELHQQHPEAGSQVHAMGEAMDSSAPEEGTSDTRPNDMEIVDVSQISDSAHETIIVEVQNGNDSALAFEKPGTQEGGDSEQAAVAQSDSRTGDSTEAVADLASTKIGDIQQHQNGRQTSCRPDGMILEQLSMLLLMLALRLDANHPQLCAGVALDSADMPELEPVVDAEVPKGTEPAAQKNKS